MLARRATDSLPETLGYIGVDLMLGEDAGSADDRIIEINPRLTTSYIGLRAAARTNLAMAILDVAEGRDPDLSFKSDVIEFDADGTVRAR
jgi:predicted ATP-grasp superfamily ATP-dependent carboligase